MSETKSPGALAAHGAIEIDGLGRRVVSETSQGWSVAQAPIHATLIGDDCCKAEGITARGLAPVLGLCRKLVAAGHDPAVPLEAWRGDILALRVRSIGEGAGLRVATHGVGFERLPECTGGPPVRQKRSPVVFDLGSDATRVRAACPAPPRVL